MPFKFEKDFTKDGEPGQPKHIDSIMALMRTDNALDVLERLAAAAAEVSRAGCAAGRGRSGLEHACSSMQRRGASFSAQRCGGDTCSPQAPMCSPVAISRVLPREGGGSERTW